jgi:hypothetical protein
VTAGRLADAVASMAGAAHFSASVTTSKQLTTVCLVGVAEAADADLLDELFRRVHADTPRDRGAAVLLDVRALEVMSSPGVRALLRWISGLDELAPEERYEIRILSDPAVLWQRGTLVTLQAVASDRVIVEAPSHASA